MQFRNSEYALDCVPASEEAKRGCCSDLGFHGYSRLELDHGGKAGHSPIRLGPVGMLVGVSYDDHFIGPCITRQLFQPRLDRRIRSYDRCSEFVLHGCPLPVLPERIHGIDWGQEFDWLVSNESQEALLWRREQSPGCRVRLRGDHLHRYHEVRLLQYSIWPELVAV